MKKIILNDIGRIAQTHFIIKPMLIKMLTDFKISKETKVFFGNANNYYEFWEKSFGEKFYDMGTFVRLAMELEKGLKYFYIKKIGHKNLFDLKKDSKITKGIFQRIMPWHKNGVINLFKNELNYDLNSNPVLKDIQKFMLLRHLYTHSSGLVDEDFVRDYKILTGENLKNDPSFKDLEIEDVYFFGPISDLNNWIEKVREFVENLPD